MKTEAIKKTLKYMESKQYKECIANAQKEFRSMCNRDIEFFNMGRECFRKYVLRMIDEEIKENYKERNYMTVEYIYKTKYEVLKQLKEIFK